MNGLPLAIPATDGLSTSDKIALANTFISAAAALVALIAAVIAGWAVAAQVTLARLDRRYTAFRAYVADPGHAGLTAFEDSIIPVVNDLELRVRTLVAQNVPVSEVMNQISVATSRFKDGFEPLYYRVVGAGAGWDTELGDRLANAFEAMEDDIIAGISRLASGAVNPSLAMRVRNGTSSISQIIAHFDVQDPTSGTTSRLLRAVLPAVVKK